MADFFTEDLLQRKDRKVNEINAGRYLPMLPPERPVDPQWKCQSSGECCTIPKEVVMTKQEAAHLVARAPTTITLQFRPVEKDSRMVAMKAGPCPLFIFHSCIVYEHRPYNCRRFICMRPDVKAEPLEEDGWKNHMDRVNTNRTMRRLAIRNQKKAQRWGNKMGWSDTPAPEPSVIITG